MQIVPTGIGNTRTKVGSRQLAGGRSQFHLVTLSHCHLVIFRMPSIRRGIQEHCIEPVGDGQKSPFPARDAGPAPDRAEGVTRGHGEGVTKGQKPRHLSRSRSTVRITPTPPNSRARNLNQSCKKLNQSNVRRDPVKTGREVTEAIRKTGKAPKT